MWKIAWKHVNKKKTIYGMIVVLMVMVFLICIVISSAIATKTEKYAVLAHYMKQNGICINASFLQIDHEGSPLLVRDEQELKDRYPGIKDVVAMETTWDVSLKDINQDVELVCYSENIVHALAPNMLEGRWFQKSDENDEMLKVVVTYNEGEVSVGDIITLNAGGEISVSGEAVAMEAEVIGVMEDDESIFYKDVNAPDYADYRDFYYTYDYEAEEGKIFVIASDAQILAGEKKGLFKELNFRLSPYYGIQKQMMGEIILTFDDEMTQADIRMIEDDLKKTSGINRTYDLKKVNKNSKAYIYDELRRFLPVGICIFLFVLVAVISVHVISTKEHLRDYSIYYICGLTWGKCAKVSLVCSSLLVLLSWSMITVSFIALALLHIIDIHVFHFGYIHLVSVIGMAVIFISVSGLIPYMMAKKDSPVRVLKENFG